MGRDDGRILRRRRDAHLGMHARVFGRAGDRNPFRNPQPTDFGQNISSSRCILIFKLAPTPEESQQNRPLTDHISIAKTLNGAAYYGEAYHAYPQRISSFRNMSLYLKNP